MRHVVPGLVLGLLLCACQAKDGTGPTNASPQAASSPSSALTGRAKQAWQAMKSWGQARVVAKGAKPELVIQGDAITFDGRPLVLGSTIDQWKATIGTAPRHLPELATIYVWDDLGMRVMTSLDHPTRVTQLTVQVNPQPIDPYEGLVTKSPDGSAVQRAPVITPRKTFAGYLELDGYGIDAKTTFADIRSSVNPTRGLRCGLRDCSHPHGAFGSDGGIYLLLTGSDEKAQVQEFVVNRH